MAEKKKKKNVKKKGLYARGKKYIHAKVKKGLNALFAATKEGRDIHSVKQRHKKRLEDASK